MRLYEISDKSVVVMFAYSNPPTKEYDEYFKEVKRRAVNATAHTIFLNPMVDAEINPLSFADNLKFNRIMFNNVKFNPNRYSDNLTALKKLAESFNSIVVLVLEEDKNLFEQYRGDMEHAGLVDYLVEVIGERENHNEIARKAVVDNEYDVFRKCFSTNNKHILSQLFITMRKAMMLGDDRKVTESKLDIIKAEKTHGAISELLKQGAGVNIVESQTSVDKIGNRVFKTNDGKYSIIEVKSIDEPRIGFDKLSERTALFVPNLNSSYIYKNAKKLSELLESATTSCAIASTNGVLGKPLKKVDSVEHIVSQLDPKDTDKLSTATRLFLNANGYIDGNVIKKLQRAIK